MATAGMMYLLAPGPLPQHLVDPGNSPGGPGPAAEAAAHA